MGGVRHAVRPGTFVLCFGVRQAKGRFAAKSTKPGTQKARIVTRLKITFIALIVAAALAAASQGFAHQTDTVVRTLSGAASWYGPKFDGRLTASGEPFDMDDLTAAHRTLPFGTRIRVTNETNGKSVIVRINDRGPFAGKRVIDLSRKAAQAIGLMKRGVGRVKIEVLEKI